MRYTFNGKGITIPDKDLENSMKAFGISKEEAIQLWLEDEGYLENEIVEELTEKAKVNKIQHEARSVKPSTEKKPRERKPDEEKEKLIEMLASCLKNNGISAEITNKSKIIEFVIGENHYKLDLIKQRPPKK